MDEGGIPPRLHADEVAIDTAMVREMVREQFPEFGSLSLTRQSTTGTDCAIFRLGEQFGVRLPRVAYASHQVRWEAELLPRLAPVVGVELALPVKIGEPDPCYPFPWLVYEWVDGVDVQHVADVDFARVADELAAFLRSLQAVDVRGGPRGGRHEGEMLADDPSVRSCLRGLRDVIDADAALGIWQAALDAYDPALSPVWVHGDLGPGNVIVRDGGVAGIIDWSSAGVGDPSCELMIAWSMPGDARGRLRAALEVDDATWARAKGLVVEQAAHFIPYYAATIPEGVRLAIRRLEAVIEDQP